MLEEVKSVKSDLIGAQRELVRAYAQEIIDYSESTNKQDQLSNLISKLEKVVKNPGIIPDKVKVPKDYSKGFFDYETGKDIIRQAGTTSRKIAKDLNIAPAVFSRYLSGKWGVKMNKGSYNRFLKWFAEIGYDPKEVLKN